MTPNIPTMLMAADFEDKHSNLLAAARIGKPHEPKTGCAPDEAAFKNSLPLLMKMSADFLEKYDKQFSLPTPDALPPLDQLKLWPTFSKFLHEIENC